MVELQAPENLTLTKVNSNILIKWDFVTDASSYEIWRKIDNGIFSLINKTVGNTYTDPSLPAGKECSYYIAALGEDFSYTVAFNEKGNVFSSFFDYHPSMYIEKGFKLLTTNPENNKLYEHFKGEYTTYYGTKYPSQITLQVNPNVDLECVFNNIEYRSELYIDDIDQPTKTLTHISAWNEYQDTGRKVLTIGMNSNIRRKFRTWRAQIPRDDGTRNRIRNPWCFLKLELDTEDNSKLILHDVVIYYTV